MCSSGFNVVAIPETRFKEVIEHLRFNFFADEPLNCAVGLCRKGESHFELENHCLATLKQGYSRMLVTDDGTIGGLVLNGILKKGEREEAFRRLEKVDDEKFKTIFGLLHTLNSAVNLFTTHCTDELFECRILSVDEKFRGQGLANTLLSDTIEVAKKAGFKVIKADATGIYSQKVFEKHGFQTEFRIPYSEIDEKLRPKPPHKELKLMVLDLH
ncbi:uncharacterized protein AANATL7 [Chelonus insularis]|uniref:uncharacterized protein AANATL7 n=1 Tax=Chelonus insularis TaxID=460826 RepID=UPI0015894C4F|nr:uncharacterized protein LOC118068440 [Chelonus insularis]